MIWKTLLNSLRNQSGVSLVELMISLGLSAFLAVGITTFLTRHSHFFDDLKAHQQMRTLARQIEQTIEDPNLLAASTRNAYPVAGPFPQTVVASGNIALKNCIDGTGTGCLKTDPEHQETFNLMIPFKKDPAHPEDPSDPATAARHTLAGDQVNPVRYRLRDGIRCTPTDVGCDLEVRAYFWATCPQSDQSTTLLQNGSGPAPTSTVASATPSTCPRAQTINVRFQIVYTATGTKKMTLQNYPTDEVFWAGPSITTSFGASAIKAASIPQEYFSPTTTAFSPFIAPPSGSCPIANETLVSIENGQPICKCLFPFKPSPSTGTPTACIQPNPCSDPKTRYRGVDDSGNPICTPICCQDVKIAWPSDGAGMTRVLGMLGIPVPDLSWVPIIRSVVQLPSSGETSCKQGGWIRSITPAGHKYAPIQVTSDLDSSCIASNCYEVPILGILICPANTAICSETIECCYEYDPGGGCHP